MCAYTCVYIYICIYIYVYVYMYVCVYIHIYTYMMESGGDCPAPMRQAFQNSAFHALCIGAPRLRRVFT